MRKTRRASLKTAIKCDRQTEQRRQAVAWLLVACALAAMALCSPLKAEDDKKAQKEYENRLKQQRAAADLRNSVDNATTEQQKNAAKRAVKEAQSKEQQRRDMAEFKQKTLDNLASIKEMFAKAEDSWKNTKYCEAGALYASVSLATVPGSEQMVETSRGRMVELEDLAKTHLKNADDADLKRDYVKQVEELALINREFTATKTREVALRRLVNLKSRPEVSGHVEIAQAEGLEADGKLMEAITAYTSIATNPRYENSVAALKAKRKLDELNTNETTREKIKLETDAKADREAPILLASAKNFVSNNLPKQAIEKLQQVIDKYPDSKYAEDAKKQISELK